MVRPLAEQVVVITGASSGIGRATALKCAQGGATVILAARGEDALEEVSEQIQRDGGRSYAYEVDVSDYAQVTNLANEVIVAFGRIDTWINDAAVALYATVLDTDIADFEQVIRVNLIGTFNGIKAVLPYMQRQGEGTIINVGSVLSKRAVPLQAAYVAAKHGVKGLSDSLRMELQNGDADIQVTLVMPASINTPFFTHARSRMGVRPQPIPPVYPVEQAADAIVQAIRTRPRDVYVGGAALMFITGEKFIPAIIDRLLGKPLGYRMQQTQQPDTGRDSLYAPLEGTYRSAGDFAHLTKTSLYTPAAVRLGRWFVPVVAAVAGVLALFVRVVRR